MVDYKKIYKISLKIDKYKIGQTKRMKKGSEKMIKRIKEILNRSIDNKEISYEYLNKLMKERKAFLIDVRSSQEYEEGHINGAINLPVYNIEKQITKVIPNKNDVVILYCLTGNRSKKAKKILEKLGYTEVYNLKGGIEKIWVS